MAATPEHISVYIDCHPAQVYDLLCNPENFAAWSNDLKGPIEQLENGWLFDSHQGPVKVCFSPRNDFGILDYSLTLSSGEVYQHPLRILPNGLGSEVVMTIWVANGTAHQDFLRYRQMVKEDLIAIKDFIAKKQLFFS